jgi:hypothetical protein
MSTVHFPKALATELAYLNQGWFLTKAFIDNLADLTWNLVVPVLAKSPIQAHFNKNL